jgi:DNA-binding transcriptional LysR family regulator
VEALESAAERLHAAAALVVGAQASVADELLPAVLAELRETRPDLDVQLRPEPDRARLLAALARGELDAVVLLDSGDNVGDLGFPRPTSTMDHLDIREVPMRVVVARESPLLGRPVAMEEIQRTGGLIGREPRCSFWMATQRWLGPDVDLTAVGGLAQVREWVATGRGIALLPDFAVRADLESGRLARVDVRTPPLQLRLIWLRDREATGSLRPILYALARA